MSRNACVTMQMLATGLVAYLSDKLGVTFYLLGLKTMDNLGTYFGTIWQSFYLSGMAASRVEALEHPNDKTYGWSSRKGAIGIAKKVAYLFVIAVAMVIDYVIIQTSSVLGASLPNTMLSLLVTVWYLLNEALSITENAGRMGAPVPEWLAKYIAVLKNKIDSKGENGDNHA